MNTRLQEIIRLKTNGRQRQFASLLGWSPQYLTKLLKGGGNFGLHPVLRIIKVFPDIDVCWLLTGRGEMLSENKRTRLRRRVVSIAQRLLDLERLVPAMNSDELLKLEDALTRIGSPAFDNEELAAIESRANKDEGEISIGKTEYLTETDEHAD